MTSNTTQAAVDMNKKRVDHEPGSTRKSRFNPVTPAWDVTPLGGVQSCNAKDFVSTHRNIPHIRAADKDRQGAQSAACDAMMLDKLQNRSQQMLADLHNIQAWVKKLHLQQLVNIHTNLHSQIGSHVIRLHLDESIAEHQDRSTWSHLPYVHGTRKKQQSWRWHDAVVAQKYTRSSNLLRKYHPLPSAIKLSDKRPT
jgi:hypothetical protein